MTLSSPLILFQLEIIIGQLLIKYGVIMTKINLTRNSMPSTLKKLSMHNLITSFTELFMKKNLILTLLIFTTASSMQAGGIYDWMYQNYKTVAAASITTACLARAAWAKYTQGQIAKSYKDYAAGRQNTRFGLRSNQGGRKTQEDAASHEKSKDGYTTVAGIFDGHQKVENEAHRVSFIVAARLSKKLASCVPSFWSLFFKGKPKAVDASVSYIDSHITEAFSETNSAILKNTDLDEQGSTAVCTIIHPDSFTIAHVGDSRAVLGTRNSFRELTQDHNLRNHQEFLRVENTPGARYRKTRTHAFLINSDEKEHTVSRSFGDKTYTPGMIAIPEISHHKITPDDEFVILASDGIWEAVSSQAAVEIVRNQLAQNKTLEEAAQELINQAAIAPIERSLENASDTSLYTKRLNSVAQSEWKSLRESNYSEYVDRARREAHDNQTVAILTLK